MRWSLFTIISDIAHHLDGIMPCPPLHKQVWNFGSVGTVNLVCSNC